MLLHKKVLVREEHSAPMPRIFDPGRGIDEKLYKIPIITDEVFPEMENSLAVLASAEWALIRYFQAKYPTDYLHVQVVKVEPQAVTVAVILYSDVLSQTLAP